MGTKKHGSSKKDMNLDSKKEPQRLTWKSKYEQICASHVTNGTDPEEKEEETIKCNALDGLSGYLSSDSSSGESELNEEVDNFIKEVDELYEMDKKQQNEKETLNNGLQDSGLEPNTMQCEQVSAPTVSWQECFDSSTGFTYYWNMETNEVTWDMPPEYQSYIEALKQWQHFQAQGVAALLQARVQQHQQQLQQQQQQQQQQLLYQNQQGKSNATNSKNGDAGKGFKRKSLDKNSDSEDEKIELITSYGPFSEDESSDTDRGTKKNPPASVPRVKKKKVELRKSPPKMGPQLPPSVCTLVGPPPFPTLAKKATSSLVPYHPEYDEDSDPEESPVEKAKVAPVAVKGGPGVEDQKDIDEDEKALLDRLRSQTQVLKELGGEIPEEVKSIITESKPRSPTATADQEAELERGTTSKGVTEEGKNVKTKITSKVKKLLSSRAKMDTEVIGQLDRKRGASAELEGQPENAIRKKEISTETGHKKKSRLEKTRLLFEEAQKQEPKPREEGSRGGFGFVSVAPTPEANKNKAVDKIAFVKADIFHLSEEEPKVAQMVEAEAEERMDIRDVSGVLRDKMKFLSDAKEPVSAVQHWLIQLETLLSAWDSSNLKRGYLEDWLDKTRTELETLESSVAPDGWLCTWQREEKRYSYRNRWSGEVVWEFPGTDTGTGESSGGSHRHSGGGEEEMDLSTTPPPPPTTPPPPVISAPSPPSPPLISSFNEEPAAVPSPVPPLPREVPPLPPLPPPSPPPPPPRSPPPVTPHPSQPLPPGVDPPDLPPLPAPSPLPAPHIPMHPPEYAMHPIYPTPAYYQPVYPQPPTTLTGALGNQDISAELDSFYSDLASLEPEQPPGQPPLPSQSLPPPPVEEPPPPPPPGPGISPVGDLSDKKKKKKTKLAPGLSLKKKGVSSLVAKWQQVQEDVRRDMKHIDHS